MNDNDSLGIIPNDSLMSHITNISYKSSNQNYRSTESSIRINLMILAYPQKKCNQNFINYIIRNDDSSLFRIKEELQKKN